MMRARHGRGELREGFTTGSAVAAAAAAALETLLTGEGVAHVAVLPPPDDAGRTPEERLRIPVSFCERVTENGVPIGRADVIKDAGDDPDATHGMLLTVRVSFAPFTAAAPPLALPGDVTLYAGEGIGRATLQGLPIAVGEMAVNPAPRRQIAAALRETAARLGHMGPVHCRIDAPEGEKRARHTLNPRLGILGGISILGTRGTVKAFSTEAWQATIVQAMDVARAQGCRAIACSTGRRSESALEKRLPELAPQAFVQVADHAGFAAAEAARRGFGELLWGCFPGKLLKLAQGLAWTHARAAAPDFALLAAVCVQCGVPRHVIDEAVALPTVLGAMEAVHRNSPRRHAAVTRSLAKKAAAALREMAALGGTPPAVCVYVFTMQGQLLAKAH